MKLLVSKRSSHLKGITTVKSLKGVDLSNVECLIFNSSDDSDLETIFALSLGASVVSKIIYIPSKLNLAVYSIFSALGADIYDTEDYLEDQSVVDFMIDSYKQTGMSVKPINDDVDIISKSISTISSVDKDTIQSLVNNPLWLKTLKSAVANVETAVDRAQEVNVTTLESWKEASKFIDLVQTAHKNTSKEIAKLHGIIEDMNDSAKEQEKVARPNTPLLYSTYHIPHNSGKVMYIRGYGYCKFLTSFLLAYQNYLKFNLQKTCKVLLAVNKSKLAMLRYKEMPRLAPDSVGVVDMRANDAFVTFEPKKIVLDSFLNISGVHLYVVIDMLFNDSLIDGSSVESFSAVSNYSDISRFSTNSSRTFIAMVGSADNFIIPFIKDVVGSVDTQKRSLYFKKCNDNLYARLNDILFGAE